MSLAPLRQVGAMLAGRRSGTTGLGAPLRRAAAAIVEIRLGLGAAFMRREEAAEGPRVRAIIASVT